MIDMQRPSKETVRYLTVSLLAIFLQGIFLVNALRRSTDAAAWTVWAVALVICAAVVIIATRRSVRLARKARQDWGEK